MVAEHGNVCPMTDETHLPQDGVVSLDQDTIRALAIVALQHIHNTDVDQFLMRLRNINPNNPILAEIERQISIDEQGKTP